jgi:Domain of unknown function (DUF929)
VGCRVFVGLVALLVLPATAAAARTDGSKPAPPRIAQLVTHVPTSTLNEAGAGATSPRLGLFKLNGSLTSHGKPELLIEELAWCPHCAANSWSIAVALSRFGRFSGLRVINTGKYYCKIAHDPCVLSPFPCYPDTNGLSFFGSTFTSQFLSFTSVVVQNLHGRNFQKPTPLEHAAINSFDPQGNIPVFDVGGKYGMLGVGYDPADLAHETWSQIARSLANPHSRLGVRIDGFANILTAAICQTTNGQPRRVCSSPGVTVAAAQLNPPPAPPGPPGQPGPPS